MSPTISIPDWPCAFGPAPGQGSIRGVVDDFIVNEILGFEHSGRGEHACLLIEKKGENTDYVARQLARFAGVKNHDVGYAGLKDRHALTRQWFSIYLPGKKDPDWRDFETDNIKVLQTTRHTKKLKRGALNGNAFKLVVREWQGDREKTIARLESIKTNGMPNYFGAQRFGREGRNVNKALQMFQGEKVKRQQRSIYLSAARSFLFNQILCRRIMLGNWNKAVSGDTFIFNCSGQLFTSSVADKDIINRLHDRVIHPTGSLWGAGDSLLSGEALSIETQVLKDFQPLCQGLTDFAVAMARRALRVNVQDMSWTFPDRGTLVLSFVLPAGSYATSLLKEIITVQ